MRLPAIFPSSLKQRRLFILVTSIILLFILALQIINRRFWMHDFEVYYLAAQAFMNDQPVYGRAYIFDTAFYKYSPFSLYLFVPFSILPYAAAKVIFFLLISAATVATLLLAAHLLQSTSERGQTYSNGLLFIVMGIVSSQVFRELHLGNVNMILLLLLLVMLHRLLKGKQVSAGIVFALVLFIKPHFFILVPLLLFRKQFQSLAVTASGIITGILLPVFLTGFDKNMVLYQAWVQTMQKHNASLREAYDTIYALLLRRLPDFLTSSIQISEKAVVIVLLITVAAVFGWFVIANMLRERKRQPQQAGQAFVIEFLVLIALVPNLVITDAEHFLLSIPLILFLLGLMRNKTPLWFRIMVVFSVILYAMNIHDLVGASVSLWLTRNGVLGLGNFMLIGLTVYGYLNFEIKRIASSPATNAAN